MLSAGTWVAYLVGYEFLFRGFLFHATLQVWSLWPAIALNCILYALAHFYKGPGEIIGAIPVGILLCYLTLHTGNIWSAMDTRGGIVHVQAPAHVNPHVNRGRLKHLCAATAIVPQRHNLCPPGCTEVRSWVSRLRSGVISTI